MTLEELKQLKEKTDNLIITMKNDRQILCKEKQEREERFSQDLMQLWKELQSYLEFLIRPESVKVIKILENDYFFNSLEVCVDSWGDLTLRARVKGCETFYISNRTDLSNKELFKDKILVRIIKEILERQEEIKEATRELVALCIESNLNKQKKINDNIFDQIKDLEN